jgi:hypothetical protein
LAEEKKQDLAEMKKDAIDWGINANRLFFNERDIAAYIANEFNKKYN